LVLSDFRVTVTSDDLQDVETNAEQAEHEDHEHLDEAQPSPKVLRCVFEFHVVVT